MADTEAGPHLTPPVRWGIVGCGDVTEVKSGPALQRIEGSRLVAVMRRTPHLARDYAERHGVPRWTDDADALIHDPEVDAVYVATPPSSHRAYTEAAAAAGKPVYVEKPMAMDEAECDAMVAACERAGVPLFVAYYRRALPRFEQVRAWLRAGAIGTPLAVQVLLARTPSADERAGRGGWRVDPAVAGGGYLMDLASHTLDLLDHLLGPIDEVRGLADNRSGLYPAEDVVAGAFRFATGVHGSGLWSFTAGVPLDRVTLLGSEGAIRFATFDEAPLELRRGDEVTRVEIAHPAHVQEPLLRQVVDALLGRGACASTGHSARRTNRVLDALLAGYRARPGGRAPG